MSPPSVAPSLGGLGVLQEDRAPRLSIILEHLLEQNVLLINALSGNTNTRSVKKGNVKEKYAAIERR